ncbi:unnamed protein product, partial [Cladocopium goreaui]
EVCDKNVTRPVALHASSTGELASLQAIVYHGWPVVGGCRLQAAQPAIFQPRVAVLIGSLLRGLHKLGHMLRRLFRDRRIRYRIFIYSSPLLAMGNNLGCVQLLDGLLQDMPHRLTVRYATRSENLQEEEFERTVHSRHMRQWFKLERAYDMMEAYEQKHQSFDLVLKLRTDVFLPAPLDLADFPEVLTSRTIYSFTDVAFLSRRDVAQSLLKGVTRKLAQYAGNQRSLFPLNLERLLRNGWVNGFRLQTFPDIGTAGLPEAIASGRPELCVALLRRHLAELQMGFEQNLTRTFSGHWRFRPDTPEYQAWLRDGKLAPDSQMCSVTRWFYLIHRTLPEVLPRHWPGQGTGKMGLFPERFAWHCNCEPPGCWPFVWGNVPPALVHGVDWIQHPETGSWLSLRSAGVTDVDVQ